MFDNQVRTEGNEGHGQLMNVTHLMISDFSDNQRLHSFFSVSIRSETRENREKSNPTINERGSEEKKTLSRSINRPKKERQSINRANVCVCEVRGFQMEIIEVRHQVRKESHSTFEDIGGRSSERTMMMSRWG